MPQHSNAVLNRPRVLFFVLLISLLHNTLYFTALGQQLEQGKGTNESLNRADIAAVPPLRIRSVNVPLSAAPLSPVAEATEDLAAAARIAAAAGKNSLSTATPISLAATTLTSPQSAKALETSPGAHAPPYLDVIQSIPGATAAALAAEHATSVSLTGAPTTRTAVSDSRWTRAARTGGEPTLTAAAESTLQSKRITEPSIALSAESAAAGSIPLIAKQGNAVHLTEAAVVQTSVIGATETFSPKNYAAAPEREAISDEASAPKATDTSIRRSQATPAEVHAVVVKSSVTKATGSYSARIRAIATEVFRRAAATVAPGFLPGRIAARVTAPSVEGERGQPAAGTRPALNSREHLKIALCRKYYKFVLGVHSSYNVDTLDCEYRPEPGTYIAEQVKEIPVQKDAAQARLDRIEAFKKLQRDAEANPTDRIIVEWDTTCLKQLPTLIQDYITDEPDAGIPLFDAYELQEASEQIVLKRGVYLRDRIGAKEKADPEVRKVLKGREYALGVIASSLGLQVSKRDITAGGADAAAASAAGTPSAGAYAAGNDAASLHCGVECKRTLQGVMLDATAPTIQAAHYSKLGVDVLHIKNLKRKKQEWKITRASEIPALVIRLAQERSLPTAGAAAVPLQPSTGYASPAFVAERVAATASSYLPTRSVHTAELAVSCILKISDDQKREVQSFRAPRTAPVEELSPSRDPEQPRQWHLHSFLGNYTLWADRAWPELAGQPGHPVADKMIVAVLDTGCFIHQDFIDGFDIENSRFWVNRGETDCENHIDDDGNGYVDDCFGWDFVGDQAYPFVDDLGHGTSVTSVLAARHGDALGGRGIIATGKIMCLRVGGRDGIWLSDTIPALDYALRMGAKVSNHSYGGKGFDQAEFSAFRRASQADHLAVTAAGNSGCDIDKDESCLFTPGAFDLDGILNVGANDVAGYRTSFSNYGKKGVDVYAPGKSIFVGTNKAPNNVGKTCKHYFGGYGEGNFDLRACAFDGPMVLSQVNATAPTGYEFIDGTSFAAPMVSGIAAALWTHFEITQPVGWVGSTQKKSLRVKEAIMYSVTGSRGVAGAGRVNGVVNFYKALHYYDTVPPTYAPEFPDPPNGYQPQGSFSLRGSSPAIFLLALAASFHTGISL